MSTMDIGLDFVLNFNIISSMMLYMFIVIYFIYVYYHVIRFSLYPIIVCCKLLYFGKWNAEINQTELNWTELISALLEVWLGTAPFRAKTHS